MENTKKKSLAGLVLRYAVPLVVSVGLCWLLFHDFDFRTMLALVREECRWWWVAAGMCVTVGAHFFRALRWRLQLRALGMEPSLFHLLLSVFGTYAVNLVFPRLGEVWRSGYVARRENARFTTVFGSMVADRLADTLSVFLLLLLAVCVAGRTVVEYLGQNGDTYARIGDLLLSPWLWGAVLILAALSWWLLARPTRIGWIRRIQGIVRELWQGFAVVLRMPRRGLWLLYTLGIWGCFFLATLVEFFCFDFTASVVRDYGLTAVLVTFVLSSVSMAVPSNGGIGPWQWAVIFALSVYALPTVQSAAFANLIMAATTLVNIVLGIFTFAVIALDRRRAAKDPHITQHSNTES